MKGYIAFCPHFHQPHFQLYKTREEAYENSYIPWLELLEAASKLNNFYINLHFSGPFLYWVNKEKPEYVSRLKELVKTNKLGILGGLADEPFIQLSSRPDDYLYQIKKYNDICQEVTGKGFDQWEGIHLVERECGELILREVSRAARFLNTLPLYYLDAETFYESHFSYPGGSRDYCLKHFGFVDPFAKTTFPHIPQELLFHCLRDEIGGEEFFSVPVHSQFRYQLLKRQSFTENDNVRVKPEHYYFYIKDALEKAVDYSLKMGINKDPILLIFEDAEKFGQWSKDSQGDKEWLLKFFKLVENDSDLEFIGLKSYYQKFGYIDTYPARTSFSYPEWENWTAKRGIRGVCYGDERLRRIMCRLRSMEEKQKNFEDSVISNYLKSTTNNLDNNINDIFKRSLLESPEKFDLVSEILEKNYNSETVGSYRIINRVRNLVYQEDPKWASRHPSYGSSPYYDVQGLAYLEIADRVLDDIYNININDVSKPFVIETMDWNFDGYDEIVIKNNLQTAVINTKGGCISYYHVLDSNINKKQILSNDFEEIITYSSILQYSQPIVLTETDSELTVNYYPEGGRIEQSRNSFRCQVYIESNGEFEVVGNFEFDNYIIDKISENNDSVSVDLKCNKDICIDSHLINIEIIKSFKFTEKSVIATVNAKSNKTINNIKIYIAPQIVTSAAASDEVNFVPQAYLGIKSNNSRKIIYKIEKTSVKAEGGYQLVDIDDEYNTPDIIDYVFTVNCADGTEFNNKISFKLEANEIEKLDVVPAVKHYYKDYIFPDQSELGYHTSGLLLKPFIELENNTCSFKVEINCDFKSPNTVEDYNKIFKLINYK